MSKLKYTLKNIDQTTFVNLSGQIDETFPSDIFDADFKTTIVINLDQISMINSLGIRTWIKFLGHLSKQNIELLNCPKIFIDQVNMVHGFLASNCRVMSFYVPYFNEATSSEVNILYKYGVEYGADFLKIKSEVKGDDLNGDLEIDIVHEKYFKFLKIQ